MRAPALCTTTLPSSAAHTRACTHPAYHHPPIAHACACTCPAYHHPPVCRPVCAPALHTTPPVICPHTCVCTLTPCTTTLLSSAAHVHVCTHPAYHHPPIVYPHAHACTHPAYHPSRLLPHACTPALPSSATHACACTPTLHTTYPPICHPMHVAYHHPPIHHTPPPICHHLLHVSPSLIPSQ
ncbi:hypothetical protein ID866_12726, partial [Astraeus odoratus]